MSEQVLRIAKCRFYSSGRLYNYLHHFKVNEKHPTYVMSPFSGKTQVTVVKFSFIIDDPDNYASVILRNQKSIEKYTQDELNAMFMKQNPSAPSIPLFELMKKVFA